MLHSAISLLALGCLCVFAVLRLGLPAGLSPLAAVSFVMLWLSLGGVLGVVYWAGWVLLLLAFVAGLSCVRILKNRWKALLSPGFLLFFVVAVVALVYLGLRRPLFAEWDEFVLWGSVSRLLKTQNSMYTLAQWGYYWLPTQYPGLVMLGYFAQFTAPEFAPWQVFLGYNWLLFACVATLLAPLSLKKWKTWVPVAAAGLLLPFLFSVYGRATHMVTTYMSSYADIPAGILFGAVLAAYYVLCNRRKGFYHRFWVLMPLAALVLVKDNTFVLALVAAGIMAVDTLLSPVQQGAIKKKLAAFAAYFGAVLLPRMVWSRYITAVVTARTTVIDTSASVGDAVLMAVRQLLGIEAPAERFTQVLELMGSHALQRNITFFGPLWATLLVIVFIFVLAFFTAHGRRVRLRVGVCGLLFAGGFAGYCFSLLVSYAFIMKDPIDTLLPSYERYMASYLAGWLMVGLLFVVLNTRRARKGARFAAKGGVLAFGCALCLLFGNLVAPSLCVLGYPDVIFAQQRTEQALADRIVQAVPEDGRIFFVSQGDDGERWFKYCYYLLPRVLDYSRNGGRSFLPLEGEGMEGWEPPATPDLVGYTYFTPQTLDETIAAAGCDYVFIERLDDMFRQSFAALFSDELVGDDLTPRLYVRGADGLFYPVDIE